MKTDTGTTDCAVISVQMLRGRVLVGTRGGDMYEAQVTHRLSHPQHRHRSPGFGTS